MIVELPKYFRIALTIPLLTLVALLIPACSVLAPFFEYVPKEIRERQLKEAEEICRALPRPSNAELTRTKSVMDERSGVISLHYYGETEFEEFRRQLADHLIPLGWKERSEVRQNPISGDHRAEAVFTKMPHSVSLRYRQLPSDVSGIDEMVSGRKVRIHVSCSFGV